MLAATRAGINTVLLPARNRKDLEDVPEAARNAVKLVWLDTVDDAVAAALHPPGKEDAAETSPDAAMPCSRRRDRREFDQSAGQNASFGVTVARIDGAAKAGTSP